jgi:iron complex outermembrane receptor protein
VLVRASAGTGYRAPDLEELYKPQTAAGFDGGIDTRKCRASGDAGADPSTLPPGHPCNTIVGFPVIAGGNPALQPEESDEWDAGMLWTPLYAFSASLDLYGVRYDNKITQLPIQQILDREADAGGSPYVVRDASGNIVEVKAAFVNLARVRTRGYDLQLESHLDLGAAGKLKTDLQFTRVLLFDTEIVSGDGFVSNLTHVFGNPNRRAQLRVDWRRGRMGAALTGNYIGPLPQADYPHGLPSWTTWDAQYRLRTSWDGQFSIGVRNLFDRDPPHFAELGGYYLNGLQNIYGRVPYLRYSQWL